MKLGRGRLLLVIAGVGGLGLVAAGLADGPREQTKYFGHEAALGSEAAADTPAELCLAYISMEDPGEVGWRHVERTCAEAAAQPPPDERVTEALATARRHVAFKELEDAMPPDEAPVTSHLRYLRRQLLPSEPTWPKPEHGALLFRLAAERAAARACDACVSESVHASASEAYLSCRGCLDFRCAVDVIPDEIWITYGRMAELLGEPTEYECPVEYKRFYR